MCSLALLCPSLFWNIVVAVIIIFLKAVAVLRFLAGYCFVCLFSPIQVEMGMHGQRDWEDAIGKDAPMTVAEVPTWRMPGGRGLQHGRTPAIGLGGED